MRRPSTSSLPQPSPPSTRWHTVATLVEILLKRGMGEAEVAVWAADPAGALAHRGYRERWRRVGEPLRRVDGAVARVGSGLTREEVWDLLEPVPAKREGYLAMNGLAPEDDDASDGAVQEVPARTGSARANDLAKSAGQWLSTRFGSGAGTDFAAGCCLCRDRDVGEIRCGPAAACPIRRSVMRGTGRI